jgi:hypothetical protein
MKIVLLIIIMEVSCIYFIHAFFLFNIINNVSYLFILLSRIQYQYINLLLLFLVLINLICKYNNLKKKKKLSLIN